MANLRPISTTGSISIDKAIATLIVVQPKALSDDALYAIDQFVLRGGKLAVFVDPNAELDTSGDDPENPQAAMFADRSSDLPKLFKAWGIEYDRTKVLLDAGHALPELRRLVRVVARERHVMQPDLVRLALTVASRVVAAELATRPETIADWLAEELEGCALGPPIEVAVSPDVAAFAPEDAHPRWVVDPKLPRGTCELRAGASVVGGALRLRQPEQRLAVPGAARRLALIRPSARTSGRHQAQSAVVA